MTAMPELLIAWRSADGAEHEERWESLESFRCWAVGEGLHLAYSVYEADEDGDWLLVERGEL